VSAEQVEQVLLAFAIGDAMGMPTQLLTRERSIALLESEGIFADAPADNPVCPGLARGTVTDDTYQLMILGEHLVEFGGGFEPRSFANRMLEWENLMMETGSHDLLGPSTKSALLEIHESQDATKVSLAGTTNGASMRIPVLGCAVPILPAKGANALVDQTLEINRLSHNSLEANLAAVIVASIISAGIDGLSWSESLEVGFIASEVLTERWGASPNENIFSGLPENILFEVEHVAALGGKMAALEFIDNNIGTSLESRESVVAALAVASLAEGRPINAAQLGAALGGDSDTIAAIASALVASSGHWGQDEVEAAYFVTQQNNLDFSVMASRLFDLRQNYSDDF
jgi:ADP-ribosylglycohydrolase